MYKFFERNHLPICDNAVLEFLGVDEFLYDPNFNIVDYFSDDISVLERRSIVFGDALNVLGLYELLQNMVKKLSNIIDILHSESEIGDKERSVFSVKQLQLYFEVIDEAEAWYINLPVVAVLSSDEFKALFEQIHTIANSKEYLNLKQGTRNLIDRITHVKSISVGFNFDAKLSPNEMGLLSINDKYIQSDKLIDKILRMDFSKEGVRAIEPIVAVNKSLSSNEFDLLQDSLCRAVDKVFIRSVRNWPHDIMKYMKTQLAFLLDLLPDIQFILIVTKIHKKMMASGVPMCVPNYHKKEEQLFRAKQLCNPVLAIRINEEGNEKKVIGNDIEFDRNGKIFILTGPNNGGKSVFMVSVGMAQILAQLGMLIPAKQLDISPVDHLYVHFPKYLTKEKMGRLEEECVRIKEIFKTINQYSLCLFDETFSSTDSSEGCQLAFEILRAIESFSAHAIFSTHFHHLINKIQNSKEEYDLSSFDFLTAEIIEGKYRTYKILRKSPEGKSYASSIALKYGLSFDELIQINNDNI